MSCEQDKERSLKDYWYPKEIGEQNEILPSLKANVNRGSPLTKGIDFTVTTILYSIPLIILYISYKTWYSFLDVSNGIFVENNKCVLIVGFVIVLGLIAGGVYYWATRRRQVLLVDFAVAWPDDNLKITADGVRDIIVKCGLFEQQYIDFQTKLLYRTGLGNETYLPRPFHEYPFKTTMALSREECAIVMKNCCDQLFAQTGIDPTKDIDIVICNCSLFNPTPSISAMLMNMYKLKQTCKNYNLAGMGCSAGLVSIDLARDLLNVYPNINLLVFSTENITQNWYDGKEKGMLIFNTLFRMGGAAVLLFNKNSWRKKAKFELLTTVRIHHGKYDDSYHAVFQFEDGEGKVGVKIGRELLKCVTRALTQNMNILMPQVISYRDMFRFVIFFIKQKLGKIDAKETFMPNFRETFQAYCIHAGGRAIIDGFQENLKLTDEDCMPSRATFYRVGNTSSSSVWYEMKFIERIDTLKKGDKVWQVAFGFGLKCNFCVWRKICN
uniref:3-ketoacyl-CoA synthase n=2 Tax=Entamoeba histolytica TaxID=5759 RepID=A0A060N1E9_ENTHI|nr:fatty acid elongase, putative [Entamoeba histolytica]